MLHIISVSDLFRFYYSYALFIKIITLNYITEKEKRNITIHCTIYKDYNIKDYNIKNYNIDLHH